MLYYTMVWLVGVEVEILFIYTFFLLVASVGAFTHRSSERDFSQPPVVSETEQCKDDQLVSLNPIPFLYLNH